MSALTIKGLNVSHGLLHAVRDVSLSAHSGEVVTLVGANGAGKTTLLRILATLLRPHAGRARVLGRDLPGEGWAVRGRVGLLAHDPLLYRELSARENLRLLTRPRGAFCDWI